MLIGFIFHLNNNICIDPLFIHFACARSCLALLQKKYNNLTLRHEKYLKAGFIEFNGETIYYFFSLFFLNVYKILCNVHNFIYFNIYVYSGAGSCKNLHIFRIGKCFCSSWKIGHAYKSYLSNKKIIYSVFKT